MKVTILRGLPGSGKSTWAAKQFLEAEILSADKYFMVNGEYAAANCGGRLGIRFYVQQFNLYGPCGADGELSEFDPEVETDSAEVAKLAFESKMREQELKRQEVEGRERDRERKWKEMEEARNAQREQWKKESDARWAAIDEQFDKYAQAVKDNFQFWKEKMEEIRDTATKVEPVATAPEVEASEPDDGLTRKERKELRRLEREKARLGI